MTPTHQTGPLTEHPLRVPVLWGAAWGLIQAAAPLGFWWVDPAVVYARLRDGRRLDPRYKTLITEDSPVIYKLQELGQAINTDPGIRWNEVQELLERYGYS